MRRLLTLSAALMAAGLQSGAPARAQEWPTRPLTMVVPFAAGGGADLLGRIIAPGISEFLGEQVVVENVGGAGGVTGSYRVVKAPPDDFLLGRHPFAEPVALQASALQRRHRFRPGHAGDR